jgi:hypothetical protein
MLRTSPAAETLRTWTAIANPVAEAMFAVLQGDRALADDRERAANHYRVALGYDSSAWNLALAYACDDALKPIVEPFVRACRAHVALLSGAVDVIESGRALRTQPSQREREQFDAFGRGIAEAAQAARNLCRLRGGRPDTIRDVVEIYADLVGADGQGDRTK